VKRAFVGLSLFISQIAWGDAVYFESGRIWRNVDVVDAKQTTSGALVLIQPIALEVTTAAGGEWWSRVIHIEFGDDSASPPLVFRSPHPPMVAVVKRAVDAVTLDLSTRERIRLIGVDAPLRLDQFFGREATAFTQRLATGRKVWIEFDKHKFDSSGRMVGYVFVLPSGTFLNEVIVENGCGRADVNNQFHVNYVERFRMIEREAHKAGIGLWNQPAALEFVQKGIDGSSEPREDWMPPLIGLDPEGPITRRVDALSSTRELSGPDTEGHVATSRIPSSPSGTAKTVWVRGYYRKGTYVRGHYRSRPSR
jgi:endonuclease YncB( thermonuclease family)